jgi:hypothetical protein
MTGPAKTYTLSEEASAHLLVLLTKAHTDVSAPLRSTEKLIADIYTGRDPSDGGGIVLGEQGMPVQQLRAALEATTWSPPQTTANLFLSRVRQIVSNLTPGVPSFRSKARIPGAARLSDDQNKILRILTDRGDLRAAMRRAAFLGLLSPYFGVKLTIDKRATSLDQFKFDALEAAACGYEPFHRRFSWHSYDLQFGDLPEAWVPAWEEQPAVWDIVHVTEVYHEGFRADTEATTGCPMSIFVAKGVNTISGDQPMQRNTEGPDFGVYVITERQPACPLIIGNFLDAAPNEDVPAAEVLSWIPLMRMIVQTLVQIEREVRTANNTVLFDKNAISPKHIEYLQAAVPGARVFIPVDPDDAVRGVNATMRPVEQSSELDKYLSALGAYLRLFDDVTGVSPQDRGQPSGGRRSAHEAASISDASSRRTQDRLEVMAGVWTKIAGAVFAFQRQVLGNRVEIPLSNGMTHSLHVPDPTSARFAFDVDPVELAHLSNQGDMQAQMQWLTVLTRTQQAFATGMPRMIREALRRLGGTMGIEDVDLYLGAPTIEVGPEERYIEHLQTQQPILVLADDQHDMFMAYYARMLTRLVSTSADESAIMVMQNAIDLHKSYAAERSQVINSGQTGDVVPGVGAGSGEMDNNLVSAFATNSAPSAVPQGAGF